MAFSLPTDRTETALKDKKPRYTEAEAKAEADRCLYCSDAPCIQACPTEIDIPTFIKKIASGNVDGSAKTIFEQNLLGASCSRVCPVEVLCVGACVYNGWNKPPIQIGRLQRYATETATSSTSASDPRAFLPAKKANQPKKVACVGAGPASLAFAAGMVLEGHHAVIFEKRPVPGGLNTTGIAPYKLHAHDSVHEVEWLVRLGVEVKTGANAEVGSAITGAQLLSDYDAVYLGVGLGADSRLGIPGEEGPGVHGAVEWIEKMKLENIDPKKLGRVLIIGGGNTAIDVARECALLGAASVSMVYRRTGRDMSGYDHEMKGARLESVTLIENALPIAFLRDASGKLTGLRVARTERGKPLAGAAGVAAEWEIPCDTIALAIGQAKLRDLASAFPGVAVDAKGCIVANEKTGATGNPKVFAGGDAINGGKEVVNAVANGRDTARHLAKLWA